MKVSRNINIILLETQFQKSLKIKKIFFLKNNINFSVLSLLFYFPILIIVLKYLQLTPVPEENEVKVNFMIKKSIVKYETIVFCARGISITPL